MSTQKTIGRHAQSKNPRSLTRVSAAVTVTGGLVAGLAATGSSAGAAPTTPRQEAVRAATTPLELKTVTPAKSLVVKQAKKAAATKKSTVKKASRTQVRQALTQRNERATQALAAQRKAAQERREARAAAKEREERQQLSRTQVRRTVTQHRTPNQQNAYGQQRQRPAATATTQRQRPAATATTQRTRPAATATTQRTRPAATATTQRTRQYTVNTAATRMTNQKASAATPSRSGVVAIASRYTGIRYTWGGSTPATGLDCSGFVAYVFKQIGVNLPHQSGAIRAMTTPVSNPRPGDLVYSPGHIGIYAGNGMSYEARQAGMPSGLYPVVRGSSYGRL
ncbi:C40 family peptidase [Dermacoccus sp. Tok2021]|uniref:C40 family peptidase n=1 Tax=Dermacoccus sp. Tok2021 TaxID=2826873 RepID=UPI001CED916B|nr:C40 family peptidase [Dermacoccus sp. Tok2021]MBZ4496248.1 C40 family peptidase [Dermacoccus sp. Tok2021]